MGDAIGKEGADDARPFHRDEQRGADLNATSIPRRSCSGPAASPCSESCAASSFTNDFASDVVRVADFDHR